MRVLLMAFLVFAAPAEAKKKKPPAPAAAVDTKKNDKIPPPGDKGTNEGAQGRKNATEDAARAADSPQFEHRP